MPPKRKIILSCATSTDGYIARPDGDVEWLNRPRPQGDHSMDNFMNTIDTILWGRKTYDMGMKMGPSVMTSYGARIANYVFSHRPPTGEPPPTFQFVDEPVAAFVEKLRATKGKNIWIMGGAELTASFLDAGAIDEFSIHVIPILIGDGIPLVAPRYRDIPLKLLSARELPGGGVHLNYAVLKEDQ